MESVGTFEECQVFERKAIDSVGFECAIAVQVTVVNQLKRFCCYGNECAALFLERDERAGACIERVAVCIGRCTQSRLSEDVAGTLLRYFDV